MQQIYENLLNISTKISLYFLKTLVTTLLTYPVNVILVLIVFFVVIVNILRGALESRNVKKKDWASIRVEADGLMTRREVEGLRKQIGEVEENIRKLGLMFGNHASTGTTPKTQDPRISGISIPTTKTFSKKSSIIQTSSQSILSQLRSIPK